MPPEETSAESTETSTTSTTEESAESTTGQQNSTEASFDPSTLPPEAQAYLKKQLESEKFKVRDNARRTAAEEAEKRVREEYARKLGLIDDGEEPPAADELTARLAQEESQRFQAQVEHQAFRIGTRLGVDIDAALDSNRFMDALVDAFDEVGDDDPKHISKLNPRSAAFAAEVERALGVALEKNPRFKAAGATGPRPDPSQGARGSTGPGQLSREDVRRLAKEGKHQEIEKARLEGRLNDLLSSKQ